MRQEKLAPLLHLFYSAQNAWSAFKLRFRPMGTAKKRKHENIPAFSERKDGTAIAFYGSIVYNNIDFVTESSYGLLSAPRKNDSVVNGKMGKGGSRPSCRKKLRNEN